MSISDLVLIIYHLVLRNNHQHHHFTMQYWFNCCFWLWLQDDLNVQVRLFKHIYIFLFSSFSYCIFSSHESPRSLWMISGCPDIWPWGCVFVLGSGNFFLLQRPGGIFQTLCDNNLHGTVHFHLVLGDHGLLLTKFIQNHEHNEILLIRRLNTRQHIFLITSNTHTRAHSLTHSHNSAHNHAHRYDSSGCWSWPPIAFSQVDQVYFCNPECNRSWIWVPEIWGNCLPCRIEGQQRVLSLIHIWRCRRWP